MSTSDIVEAAGIQLPAGAARTCSACLAKLVSGEVDQSEQSFCAQKRLAILLPVWPTLCLIARKPTKKSSISIVSLFFAVIITSHASTLPAHPYHLWASSELQNHSSLKTEHRILLHRNFNINNSCIKGRPEKTKSGCLFFGCKATTTVAILLYRLAKIVYV